MAKVTITVWDTEDDNVSLRMEADPPFNLRKTETQTDAQSLTVQLLDTVFGAAENVLGMKINDEEIPLS